MQFVGARVGCLARDARYSHVPPEFPETPCNATNGGPASRPTELASGQASRSQQSLKLVLSRLHPRSSSLPLLLSRIQISRGHHQVRRKSVCPPLRHGTGTLPGSLFSFGFGRDNGLGIGIVLLRLRWNNTDRSVSYAKENERIARLRLFLITGRWAGVRGRPKERASYDEP